MNVIKCKNGHFFDGDTYATCPHCGEVPIESASAAPAKEEKRGFWGRGRKDKGANAQLSGKNPLNTSQSKFGAGDTPTDVIEESKLEDSQTPPLKKNPTLDFWQTSSHSDRGVSMAQKTDSTKPDDSAKASDDSVMVVADERASSSEQAEPKREAVGVEKPKSSEQPSSLLEAVKKSSASNEGKTMSYFSAATSQSSAQSAPRPCAEPVVGWLVCVGGCNFGQCFNISAGKNSIGRSEENRIVIPDDNGISRIKHALIVYEPKKRNFYLQPGDSSGLTYLNEDYITDSQKLTAHDMIELGDSKFMFIPLCGEAFSWEDYMPKGE